MVTVGPSDVTSTGISFPVVSFREIFAELESMSWSKVAVSLSALVGIFIEPFAGDVPIVCGGSSIDGCCRDRRCYGYSYRAYIALSLMTIDHLEGETIISRKASGWSKSYIARILVYLTERAMFGCGGVTISADRESPVSLSIAPRAMSTGLSASIVTC